MEPVGALSEINWSTFNGTLSTDEAEFMSQLLGSCPFMDEQDCDPSFGIPGTVWSGHTATGDDDSYFCSSDMFNSGFFTPIPDYENYNAGDANGVHVMCSDSSTMDVYMVDGLDASSLLRVIPDTPFEESIYLNEETNDNDLGEPGAKPSEHILPSQKAQPKRKFELLEMKKPTSGKTDNDPSENQKKKTRVSEQVQRNGRNTKSKKNAKVVVIAEEESKAALNGQSSSGDLSEDDSNASQEINGGTSSSSRGAAALNTNGKTRAGRGSATDPQSLYARKRRERINERLRILQNLVPNGTKVDISTMLEEAVDYVKFLQLQIKLLSSDDLWMYAPIAYNGINIGLDLKISSA